MASNSHTLFCLDLKEYLESAVDAAKSRRRCCITILLRKMLKKEGRRRYHVHYAVMLKKLFLKYMYGRGMYIIPLEDAEKMLIDQLCRSLESEKKEEESKQPKEKMALISFHLPKNMLEEIDRYAKMYGISRSDAVRKALEEMLEKYRPLTGEKI